MTWKEYSDANKTIGDWLPWGGIIHPFILKNRDDSLLAVIEYKKPHHNEEMKRIRLPEMNNGWSIWLENQHHNGEQRYFIAVSWNPFTASDLIKNVLAEDEPINESEIIAYFTTVLEELADSLRRFFPCKLLVYQDLLDYLSFALSIGTNFVKMPDTPLYINDLISQDADIQFNTANNVIIDKKTVLTVSLPLKPDASSMAEILESIKDYSYRHVQRLLLFNHESAEKELKKYTKSWCPGRNIIKELLLQDVIKEINGYYTGTLLILTDNYNDCLRDLKQKLNGLQLPYRVEDYNLRDVFWGSLPGIFRANITPPISGFNSFNELLFISNTDEIDDNEGTFYVSNGFI